MRTYEQLENENFIIIPNQWIRNYSGVQRGKYHFDKVLIYSLLQLNISMRKRVIFNMDWLYKNLKISPTNSTGQKRVKEILTMLKNEGFINSDIDFFNVSKNELIFLDLHIPSDNFTKIYDFELNAISKYDSKVDIAGLYSTFCCIKSYIIDKTYCYPSIKKIQGDLDIKSNNTVLDYINILTNELKLMYCINPGYRVFDDGKVKQSNNFYTMNYEGNYEYLQETIDNYKLEMEEKSIKIHEGKKSNLKRSETMKKVWAERKDISISDSDVWGETTPNLH